MAVRAASATRPPIPSSSSPASSKVDVAPRRMKATTAATTSVSLLALFSAPIASFNEAKAFTLPKEDIVSSLTQVSICLKNDIFPLVLQSFVSFIAHFYGFFLLLWLLILIFEGIQTPLFPIVAQILVVFVTLAFDFIIIGRSKTPLLLLHLQIFSSVCSNFLYC